MLTANIFTNIILTLTGLSLYITLTVFYIFFSFRYPEFAIRVIKETKFARYKKSLSGRFDTTLIESRLLQLMNEDKVFTDPDISLLSLSNDMMITPYELSHIINNCFNMNFNAFINSYRIKEAKYLLQNNPEKSITFIAYSTGFNSVSSFYSNFLKDTNLSPGDYRKRTGIR